jgi:4-hydroxy-3-polyprenylbenzoate decarboxylase
MTAPPVRAVPGPEPARRIVVGITGASGAVFGVRMLERLREAEVETHLVVSAWGARTIEHETGLTYQQVRELASESYRAGDQGAAVSSGSFLHDGMVIAPCSMSTLGAIAHGVGSNLVHRSADVTLKEGRRLVLLVREAPLSTIHLENLLTVARAGAVVLPPVPAFYNHPQSVDEVVEHIVTRTLDQLGVANPHARRWTGNMRVAETGARGAQP